MCTSIYKHWGCWSGILLCLYEFNCIIMLSRLNVVVYIKIKINNKIKCCTSPLTFNQFRQLLAHFPKFN